MDINGTRRWQFWIDRGGTFTDVVGKRPDGALGGQPLREVEIAENTFPSSSRGRRIRPDTAHGP